MLGDGVEIGTGREERETAEYGPRVHAALRDQRVTAMAYVPDIILEPIINCFDADPDALVTKVAREEEAVGVAAGSWLGGRRCALLLQSSGLGNSLNALGSFAAAYQIPMLLVVSPRGGVGEFNAAQVPFGRVFPDVLALMGVHSLVLRTPDEIEPGIAEACRTVYGASQSVAVILSRELTGGKDE
jgi:sulfopyruvate decarboxylase alpha subunit